MMDNIFKSTLSTEMHEYVDLLKDAGKYVKCYIGTFRSLDKYMLETHVSEKALTKKLIYDWLKTLSIAETTRKYTIGRIRRFSRYLAALGIPAYEPDFCRVSSNYVAYTFTDEEFDSIIDAADYYKGNILESETAYMFPILLRILYSCGLRVGEALALCWKDIDLDSGIVAVRKAKNNKQRHVPINNSLAFLLRQYHNRRFIDCDDEEFLFGNKNNAGKPYLSWTFRYWFLKILEQANISNQRSVPHEKCISPHTLRHFFTFKSFQNLVSEGYQLEEIAPYLSTYLGHESFCGTEKYLSTDYMLYSDSQYRVSNIIKSVLPEVTFE